MKQRNCLAAFEDRSLSIRRRIVELGTSSPYKIAHYGGALSVVDLINFLYTHYLRLERKDAENPSRDRFVLSKGHSCLALYSCLVEFGLIEEKNLDFEVCGSTFAGHPIIDRPNFIDYSTGSLGNGLSYAIGSSLALKSRRVACIVGDGELGEGAVWESVRIAGRLALENLLLVVDCNEFQQTGSTSQISGKIELEPIFKGFGWQVVGADGNDAQHLDFLRSFINLCTGPKVIIAKTIKGKGVEEIEGLLESHHTALRKIGKA